MIYDVIVIGAGPAGCTAALYASRSKLNTLIIEKLSAGGQMALSSQIDNYPGFDEGIDGFDLGMKMQMQAEKYGATTVLEEVKSIEDQGSTKVVHTNGNTYTTKAIIIATGASAAKMNIPGETTYTGKGVAYCALCDGHFFKGKNVVVIGGGNSAIHDATYLDGLCQSVTLIHRRDQLRASPEYLDALHQAKHLNIRYDTVVDEIIGDQHVNAIKIHDVKTNVSMVLPCEGVFISIGRIPDTGFVKGLVDMDQKGYIVADESCRTNIPGIFVAGDTRTKMVRQIVTAVADGAIAATNALAYIHSLH